MYPNGKPVDRRSMLFSKRKPIAQNCRLASPVDDEIDTGGFTVNFMDQSSELGAIHNKGIVTSFATNNEGPKEKAKNDAIRGRKLTIAFDYPRGTGQKYFVNYSCDEFVKMVMTTNPKNLRGHEVMYDVGRLTKAAFDFECERTEYNSDYDFHESIRHFMKLFIRFLAMHNTKGIEEKDFLIFEATRADKFSAHIVLYKGVCFKDKRTFLLFNKKFVDWALYQEIQQMQYVTGRSKRRKSLLFKCLVRDFRISGVPTLNGPRTDEVRRNFIKFKPLVDFQPWEITDGTLRCYGSTKVGHENDENYRLKRITLYENGEETFCVPYPLESDWILHSLSQVVYAKVEGVPTKVISYCDSNYNERRSYHESKIQERLVDYTFIYYKQCNESSHPFPVDLVKKTKLLEEKKTFKIGEQRVLSLKTDNQEFGSYCTFQDLRQGRTEKQIYDEINKMYTGRAASSTSSNDLDERCSIGLKRSKFTELYETVDEALKLYGATQFSMIFGKKGNIKTANGVSIRTNKACSYLCINIAGARCEIIWKMEKRHHFDCQKKLYQRDVYFTISLSSGIMRQRCFKEKCSKKRGGNFVIPFGKMEDIRTCTCNNEKFKEFLTTII